MEQMEQQKKQPLRLSRVQGENEQRSKAYITYAERAAQFSTPQSAKSAGVVSGSAGQQAGAARRL